MLEGLGENVRERGRGLRWGGLVGSKVDIRVGDWERGKSL